MFCSHCGAQMAPDAAYCSVCGKAAGTSPVNLDKPSAPAPQTDGGIPDGIPEGVKGWSWGAFLLNWIWAIGNRSWIGLLAMVPYVGWIMAFWLGFKGREMAWKNKQWDSLEHFNRVQRKWSQWGIGITIAAIVLGVLAAMLAPDVDEAGRAVTVQRDQDEAPARAVTPACSTAVRMPTAAAPSPWAAGSCSAARTPAGSSRCAALRSRAARRRS